MEIWRYPWSSSHGRSELHGGPALGHKGAPLPSNVRIAAFCCTGWPGMPLGLAALNCLAPKKFSELEKKNATWLVTAHDFPHFSRFYPQNDMIYACLNPQNKVLIFNLYKILWPPKSIHSCWKLLAARMNSSRWARGFQAESCEQHSWTGRPMGLSENKVPLNPLVNQC